MKASGAQEEMRIDARWREQATGNPLVAGSSPARPTQDKLFAKEQERTALISAASRRKRAL